MVSIYVNNAQSRVEAPPHVFQQLRHLVSFREQDLPPAPVQAIIRDAFRQWAPRGRRENHRRLVTNWTAQELAAEAGYDLATLTPRQVQAVLDLTGTWDGWTPLISSNGVFGTGLLPHLRRALSLRLNVDFKEIDERKMPNPGSRPLGFDPPLFDFQREAKDAFLQAKRGVLALPPRSGKTRTATAIIAELKLKTLYVVPSKGLVKQTVSAMGEFLDQDEVVGVTGGKPNRATLHKMQRARVWVATPPTAAGGIKKRKGRGSRTAMPGIQGIETREFLVFDEFHHSAAPTYREISNAAVNAYYRLGLTGTHFRSDGRDMLMHSVISQAVYERTISDMVTIGRLVPPHVAMIRVPGKPLPQALSGDDLKRRGVTESEERNGTAAWLAYELSEKWGKKVLMITQEVEHSKTVAGKIPGAWQVDGTDSEAVDQALQSLASGGTKVVVGTSVIGEGRDVPAADVLVYLPAVRSPVKVIQDTMRPLTAAPGKKFGLIFDFADQHHPSLMEKAAERLALYRSTSGFTSVVLDVQDVLDWVKRKHDEYGVTW